MNHKVTESLLIDTVTMQTACSPTVIITVYTGLSHSGFLVPPLVF